MLCSVSDSVGEKNATTALLLSRRALVDALEERGMSVVIRISSSLARADAYFFFCSRTAPEMTHADLQGRLRGWLDAVRTASSTSTSDDDALARRLALVVICASSSS